MTNPNRCDRCGIIDHIPRGYGFFKTGFNLCIICAKEWESIISKERHTKSFGRRDWANYANKLLTDFVLKNEKEKVQFT